MSLERARLSVQFIVERLRANVSQAQQQQFPGNHPGPRKWLELVAGLLDTAASYQRKSQKSKLPPQEQRRYLLDALSVSREAYKYLDDLRAAQTTDLPSPVVAP